MTTTLYHHGTDVYITWITVWCLCSHGESWEWQKFKKCLLLTSKIIIILSAFQNTTNLAVGNNSLFFCTNVKCDLLH